MPCPCWLESPQEARKLIQAHRLKRLRQLSERTSLFPSGLGFHALLRKRRKNERDEKFHKWLPEEHHDAWLPGEAGKEVLVPFSGRADANVAGQSPSEFTEK